MQKMRWFFVPVGVPLPEAMACLFHAESGGTWCPLTGIFLRPAIWCSVFLSRL